LERYDVVIIGGGAIGTCIAYNLAIEGSLKVALIERDQIGGGSTGLCAGVVSCFLWNPLDIALVKASIPFFEKMATVRETIYKEVGSLFLAVTQEEASLVQARGSLLKENGIEVEHLDNDEAAALVPGMFTDDISEILWCPNDGIGDPGDFTSLVGQKAKNAGVEIKDGVEAHAIAMTDDKVEALQTTDGTIETPLVVLATGCWSKRLASDWGFSLPLKPYRTKAAILSPPYSTQDEPLKGPPIPSTIVLDTHQRFYFRPESSGDLLVGDGTELIEADPQNFDPNIDGVFREHIAKVLPKRLPHFADAQLGRGWCGLCAGTPDRHPLIGELEEDMGLFLACGFNGFGYMRAPGIAEAIAAEILGKDHRIDIGRYHYNRFAAGIDEDWRMREGFGL